jgi:CRISPR-associated protein Csx16
MTTFFVSRHPGAVDWARRKKLMVDHFVSHLDPLSVRSGDTVIGSLPVNLAAQVCESGACYLHLSLALPIYRRGQELSADDLECVGARLESFEIRAIPLRADLQ